MRRCGSKRRCCSALVVLVMGCTPMVATVPPTSVPTLAPTATPIAATALPVPTRTPTAVPTSAPRPTNLKTFHVQIAFDTYETEETIQAQLGRLPGVASLSVTQLDVTLEYDPTRLTEDDILRTLRANPEVRIRNDAAPGR